jgi:hypothetical protein
MARNRKTNTKTREQRQIEQLEREFDEAIGDTVANYCCTNGTALEFAGQCESDADEIEIALRSIVSRSRSGRLSRTIMHVRSSPCFANSRTSGKRHAAALATLHERFAELASQEIHEHLEHERYEELVVDRLFSEELESAHAPRLLSP